MLALSGTEDANNGPAVMEGWRRFTTGSFQLVTVEGGHFFPKEKREEVLHHVYQLAIQPHLPGDDQQLSTPSPPQAEMSSGANRV